MKSRVRTIRARYAGAMSVPASPVRPSGTARAISGSTANLPTRSTQRSLEGPVLMSLSLLIMVGVLLAMALGGVAFAFAGAGGDKTKKRMAALAKPTASARALKGAGDTNQQRRKNVQAMLKELEKQHVQKKKRITLRRRIEQAGLSITVRTFWILACFSGLAGAIGAVLIAKVLYAAPLAGLAFTFGLPRWVLAFLKARREK